MSLSLKNITKIYPNGVKAVDNLCLEIKDKDFVVLLGPSGSGKTTLLRIIAGLEEISGGELFLDGALSNKAKPVERNVAMVFQTSALLPHLDVYGNIAFGLKANNAGRFSTKKIDKKIQKFTLKVNGSKTFTATEAEKKIRDFASKMNTAQKFSTDEIDRRVRSAAAAVGLTELLNRKPPQMSGGQKQRVALARAIATDPRIFLMDEPLSSIEPDLRGELKSEIKKLHQRLNATFIYVTHDQTEAMSLATRVAVIKDGALRQFDTPSNLYNNPADMFTAGFIGYPKINFLTQNQRLLLLDGKDFREEKNILAQNATVAIRPEHILLGKRTGAEFINFNAVINNIEELGADAVISVSLQTTNTQAINSQTMNSINRQASNPLNINEDILFKTPSPHGLKCGDTVKLSFDVNKLHYFDEIAGKAISAS